MDRSIEYGKQVINDSDIANEFGLIRDVFRIQ